MRSSHFTLWLTTGCLAAHTLVARQPSTPDAATLAPQVERLMKRYMADAMPVGASVGIERDGEVLVRGSWGLADREAKKPATPDTVYRLGSASKQFTAVLVLRLVERGAVSLDDPVDRHLPQLPRKWRGILVGQLFNHTTGVPDVHRAGTDDWQKAYSPDGLLGLVAERNLNFAPGTQYEYSNTNYLMLAMIAAKQYSKPLPQILHDELFGPLRMTATRYCEDESGANGQARGYVQVGGRIVKAPYVNISHSYGLAGVCSTVADVGLWNRALHSGTVVNAASYALMTTPQGAAAADADRYAFGLMVRPIALRRTFMHSGHVVGFESVTSWTPQGALSVTILVNTSQMPQTSLHPDLTRLAFGLPVTIVDPIAGPSPSASTLKKYEGSYTIQFPGRTLDIRFWVKGSTLMSQATGQDEVPLRAAGPDTFGSINDWTVRFTFTLENGTVTGFDFEQDGEAFRGARKK